MPPDSRFGPKRPLLSDWFYPALQCDIVTLVPAAAKTVHERGIVTDDGRELDVDVIIYCTGYKVLDFERIDVVGRHGESLAKRMAEAPEAFNGFAVPGFLNYFFALGPNSLILLEYLFYAAAVNLACVIWILWEKGADGARPIAVKQEQLRAYNDWISAEPERYAWVVGACNTDYQSPGGHTPLLFPGDFEVYTRQRTESGLHGFEVV